MKRILTLSLLLCSVFALAQNPTTTWPYLYDNFTPGTIYMKGSTKSDVMMNIHLRHDHLHFIDNDIVKQANLTDVLIVSIGADSFLPFDGEMLKIVAKNDNGVVAASIIGDFAAAQETGGGYGASSETASTRKLSSFELEGQINQNHVLLLQEKENGADLNVITTYYIIRSGESVKATRKDVNASLSKEGQDAFKLWLKSNKIKWKDPESILKVVDFLSENK